MGIQRSNVNRSMKSMFKGRDALNFDLAVQRKNNVWDLETKSWFIHSLMANYPVPPLYALKNEDKELSFVDGKQRLTSTFGFISGEYALADNTPDVDGIEVGGKYFEDLPEDLKDNISDYSLLIYCFENATEEEIDEMFFRLNHGVPLTKMELSRAIAGSSVMNFITEISNMKFFTDIIGISAAARNRYVDQELVMQIVSLLVNKETPDLSGKELQSLASKLREEGIPEDIQEIIRNTTTYLEQAITAPEKFLKKVNVPVLFLVAVDAQENNTPSAKFGGWAKTFFTAQKSGDQYGKACSSGSAKKENVQTRIDILRDDFQSNIQNAVDYTPPVSKETTGTGKRGRPKKNQSVGGNTVTDSGIKVSGGEETEDNEEGAA